MPKKLQQQSEQNGHALSREDRKNEQICRMIERAEKQRIKREEKKKLAVLNKAAGKIPVSRKQKKIGGLLPPKRTQVAIQIMFTDKARAQNASNRYYFDRKHTIEEKQRLEQEEMWARYALRMQQLQQQSVNAAFSVPSQLPVMTNSNNQGPYGFNGSGNFHIQAQLMHGSGLGFNASHVSGEASMQGINAPAQMAPSIYNSNPSFGVPQQIGTTSAVENHFYLNAGETGGNYEGGNEDQSGSSYFSSASKRQLNQGIVELMSVTQQPKAPVLNTQQKLVPASNTAVQPPLAEHTSISSLQVPTVPQQSLSSVLNSLKSQSSMAVKAAELEESKEPRSNQLQDVKIKVQLNADSSLKETATKNTNTGQDKTSFKHPSQSGFAISQETCSTQRQKSSEGGAAPVMSETEKILALTRQKMQSRGKQ